MTAYLTWPFRKIALALGALVYGIALLIGSLAYGLVVLGRKDPDPD